MPRRLSGEWPRPTVILAGTNKPQQGLPLPDLERKVVLLTKLGGMISIAISDQRSIKFAKLPGDGLGSADASYAKSFAPSELPEIFVKYMPWGQAS
jgi:hypothetical protein